MHRRACEPAREPDRQAGQPPDAAARRLLGVRVKIQSWKFFDDCEVAIRVETGAVVTPMNAVVM